jgi:hypothetical protein
MLNVEDRIYRIMEERVNSPSPGPEREDVLWLIDELRAAHSSLRRWKTIAAWACDVIAGVIGRKLCQKSTSRNQHKWGAGTAGWARSYLAEEASPPMHMFGHEQAVQGTINRLQYLVTQCNEAVTAKEKKDHA